MAGAFSGHLLQTFDETKVMSTTSSPGIITSGAMSFNARMHGYSPLTPMSVPNFTFSPTPFSPAAFSPSAFPISTSDPFPSHSTANDPALLQAKLTKKLGPEFLSQRPGPGGGPKLTYAEGWKLINLANEVFGYNGWSSSVVNLHTDFLDSNEETRRCSVGVSAIVRVTLRDGTFHEDTGYGAIENAKGKGAALDKCKKEAVTDALKRALRNFGNLLGNCLYDKSYASEVVKIKVPPAKFDRSELYRRPEFEDPKPAGPQTTPSSFTATTKSDTKMKDNCSTPTHPSSCMQHQSPAPRTDIAPVVPKQESPAVKMESPAVSGNQSATDAKQEPFVYIPRHLRQTTSTGESSPSVRNSGTASPTIPNSTRDIKSIGGSDASKIANSASNSPNISNSTMPPPQHAQRTLQSNGNPNYTTNTGTVTRGLRLGVPMQAPAQVGGQQEQGQARYREAPQDQRKVSFANPVASSSGGAANSGSTSGSSIGSSSSVTSGMMSHATSSMSTSRSAPTDNTPITPVGSVTDESQNTLVDDSQIDSQLDIGDNLPDSDTFPFNSEDDAFLAAVDLGEGDLGHAVDLSADLGRPIDFEEGLSGRNVRTHQSTTGNSASTSNFAGAPIPTHGRSSVQVPQRAGHGSSDGGSGTNASASTASSANVRSANTATSSSLAHQRPNTNPSSSPRTKQPSHPPLPMHSKPNPPPAQPAQPQIPGAQSLKRNADAMMRSTSSSGSDQGQGSANGSSGSWRRMHGVGLQQHHQHHQRRPPQQQQYQHHHQNGPSGAAPQRQPLGTLEPQSAREVRGHGENENAHAKRVRR